MNNITKIEWHLSNYCKSECSYCPVSLRGGEEPPVTKEFLRVANIIVDHYSSIDRKIEWTFNGGEPLDMDVVPILKYCRENGLHLTLHTNGGKLWMDWWAIEKYVDNLILTYHYWQNASLMDYIIKMFLDKGKRISVGVPIRPKFFDHDLERALIIEQKFGIVVGKNSLYNDAKHDAGLYPYTEEQLEIMTGAKILKEVKVKFETTTWKERRDELVETSPVYFGKRCMMGIERLYIYAGGWVAGARCNNRRLGNIWEVDWKLPTDPHLCQCASCVFNEDLQITKLLD